MKMIRLFFLFFSCLYVVSAAGQEKELKKYWIELTDKNDSPYSIDSPENYLSPRALERRAKQKIGIKESDLPINPSYIKEIEYLGCKIHNSSKWLNGISIIASEENIEKVKMLPFVKASSYVGKHFEQKLLLRSRGKERDTVPKIELLENYYGLAESQITMLKGDFLHYEGFKGKGMLIAVLDGGFSNVDIMPFFDSLRVNNRLIFPKDFVDDDAFVYESSSHGSQVLSVMGANIPGLYVGTAPEATYICLKTEDTRSEYLIEECNWVSALEYADSIGVDVINSSLGYSNFSDTLMDYSYEELDGRNSIASRAATIAAAKGMIVVNSAGNEGGSPWKYIDVPADAENILAVGAVTMNNDRARFSSIGPSSDGRIKPDVSALGQRVAVASVYSPKVNYSRGTSFSSPIIAGLAATLWQAFPKRTNLEIMDAIRKSGNQSSSPDFELGYGIPDFYMAYQFLKAMEE